MFSDDLISDLREAYAKNGRQEVREEGLCGIFVSSWDEMVQKTHRSPICEVDFPPLDGVEKNRMYLGMWWNSFYDPKPLPLGPGEWEPSPCQKVSREFLNFADRLGASLPLETRRSIEGELSIPPCASWCLLLYREHASQHEDSVYNRFWGEPFRSSLALAERLNEDIGQDLELALLGKTNPDSKAKGNKYAQRLIDLRALEELHKEGKTDLQIERNAKNWLDRDWNKTPAYKKPNWYQFFTEDEQVNLLRLKVVFEQKWKS